MFQTLHKHHITIIIIIIIKQLSEQSTSVNQG